MKRHKSAIAEFFNLYVILAYGIMCVCIWLMMIAFRGFPYKYGTIIESLGYIFIMFFSWFFFNEKITWRKVIGNLLIICGIMVFSM